MGFRGGFALSGPPKILETTRLGAEILEKTTSGATKILENTTLGAARIQNY